MGKWQKQFNVQRDYCSNNTKCTPAGLIDHLRSHNDVYHKAVKFYLENLYSDILEEISSAGILSVRYRCT